MMRGGIGFDANQAGRQLLKELQDITTLQLPTYDHLAGGINAITWKTDLPISRPIVVIACMFSSSESWELQQHPRLWHSRAGGGAVHSITSRHLRRGALKLIAAVAICTAINERF